MDLQRIERALREGPVDEPRYEPGAYRRRRPVAWVLFAGAMAGALVVGVIVGLGLNLLRQPAGHVGAPVVDLETLGEELSVSWMSGSFSEADFVDYMADSGHAAMDVAAFLEHDPIPGTARWGLDFDGRGRVVVFRTLDESRTEILNSSTYELLPDGRLRWIDGDCSFLLEFDIVGDELTFGELTLERCAPNADDRIAADTFFGLAPPYEPSSAR
jgi:hypothetical protein